MSNITTLFWDVGGVLLTNGWDTDARRRAARKFELNWEHFRERHELVSTQFEKGKLGLDEYLECVVFHEPRGFSNAEFRKFMFSQSQPDNEALNLLKRVAASRMYQMATLNNESRELNLHRIERFKFRDYFSVFFSSCFLGFKKPEPEIYQAALDVTQRNERDCLYIDDRSLNLETARRMGIHTIHFKSADQLRQELIRYGILAGRR